MSVISPSALAIKALGLSPSGSKTASAGVSLRCAMCGTLIEDGMRYDDLDLPASFTNQLSIAVPGGKHICGACKAVMKEGAFQKALATAIVSEEGYFPIMNKENRAWAFLYPPKPPFFVTVQNARQQHVVWRAPVSLSQDLILVRVGEQILRLRRKKLEEARNIVFRLDDLRQSVSVIGHKTKKGAAQSEAAESPFLANTATWIYQSADAGVVMPWYRELMKAGAVTPEEQAVLSSLNAGEVWALQAVLHRKPVQPEAITI